MWHKEHENRCIELFGHPYTEVHEWLDYLFRDYGPAHRIIRHNPEGIEQIVQMFGEEARCPALLHLYDDYEYYQYYTDEGILRKNAWEMALEEDKDEYI